MQKLRAISSGLRLDPPSLTLQRDDGVEENPRGLKGEINARHFRSRPYSKSYREHRDFLCRGAAVSAAFGSARSTATNSCSHPPLAFNATSGTDVPDARRHFSRNAAAVRVSGRIWRSDNGHTCVRSNSIRIAQLWFGQAGS